jgi:cytochrome c-type biogenesis protein CcmH
MKQAIAILVALLVALPAFAMEPGEALSNPDQEARARALMGEIRCLVCQAESVEASPSPFAAEVRQLVREQVAAGRSDSEIKEFLVARYGEDILYRPRWRPRTWALWLGPFVALGVGAVAVFLTIAGARNRRTAAPDPLTKEEQTALNRLLDEREDGAE